MNGKGGKVLGGIASMAAEQATPSVPSLPPGFPGDAPPAAGASLIAMSTMPAVRDPQVEAVQAAMRSPFREPFALRW